MKVLMPFQEAAVEWFQQLPSRRGTIVLPTGTGKTIVALAIARRTAEPGPGLVVAPAATASQWVDRATDFGLTASVLNHRTLPELIKTRNEAHGSSTNALHLWIASDRYLSDPAVTSSVDKIRWSIVIVDEAHRIAGEVRGVQSAGSVLYLTATPKQDPAWPAGMLPVYSPRVAFNLKSTLQESTFTVVPTPQESHLLRLVEEWETQSQPGRDEFSRLLVAEQCRAGVLPGIDVIERYLARASSLDADRDTSEWTLAQRGALLDILDVAYKVVLPDSRSRRLISEVRRLGGRAVVISSTASHLHYLANLLRIEGLSVVTATAAMDAAERRTALVTGARPTTPLLLSDATSSSWAMSNRDVLVHGDLPSKARQHERAGLFLDSDPTPRALEAYLIEWAKPAD